MSGRKQHFIPQSLLKGFGRTGKGDKVQVIVYSHDHGIFPAATEGVAAQREFYSKLAVEGDTLDDKITAYETPLAETLSALRNLGDGEIADKQSASEFVTHLVVRTIICASSCRLREPRCSTGSPVQCRIRKPPKPYWA